MNRLTGDRLHFEIKAALLQLSDATLRDLGGAGVPKRAALDVAADAIRARLEEVADAPADAIDTEAGDLPHDASPEAGAAQADSEAHPEQDRISRRVELALDAGIRQSGGSYAPAQVLDVSTHGFRIETHLFLREGADVWLRLPGLEGRHARVAWVRGPVVGCAFEEPLHEAVLNLIVRKAGAG